MKTIEIIAVLRRNVQLMESARDHAQRVVDIDDNETAQYMIGYYSKQVIALSAAAMVLEGANPELAAQIIAAAQDYEESTKQPPKTQSTTQEADDALKALRGDNFTHPTTFPKVVTNKD